ncbi:hypothetical protein pdul_cds_571 [Pandoravirus dulcis]|uniref:Uncharacterized protein n=1 Tax=Pandoravirus dulcis TaxID=1349409 RepID=S4VXR8_9VIRU|nr:hypothetical protein pdul_cds_571 [Pandoravirus dulcis]AGO82689.1 hypothetical protein pdul_cds_571 [Pandoravirus dulcis]
MGAAQSLPDGRAPWAWIDADEARDALLACASASEDAIDGKAMAALEHQHNWRAVADAIAALPRDGAIAVGYVRRIVDAPHTFRAQAHAIHVEALGVVADQGRLWRVVESHRHRLGTAQEIADAISGASLSGHLQVRAPHHGPGSSDGNHCPVPSWDRCWLAVVASGLRKGPAGGTWTADTIRRTRIALAALVRVCDERNVHLHPTERLSYAERVCPERALWLCSGMAERPAEITTGREDDQLFVACVLDTERDLRGMLAWVEAIERTGAVCKHILGSDGAAGACAPYPTAI